MVSETVTSNGARAGDLAEEALARKLGAADERLAVVDAEAAKIRAYRAMGYETDASLKEDDVDEAEAEIART